MSIQLDNVISNITIDRIQESGKRIDQEEWFLGDQVISVFETLIKIKNKIIAEPGQKYSEDDENVILTWGESSVIQWVADKSGKSMTTITRYYRVAKFFDPDLRDKFTILPRSHFEWVLGFPEYAEDILEVDVSLCHRNHGEPVSLRVLQALFKSVENIPEVLRQLNEMEELDDIISMANYEGNGNGEGNGENDTSSSDVPPLVFHFLQNMGTISKYIRSAVNLWDIDSDLKTDITNLVRQLAEKVRIAQFGEPEVVDK